ncbi:MAG: CHAD domain-containing protein [Nevskia sp.]|nr:CHAD domain-containing protein [Nevskia sp.]
MKPGRGGATRQRAGAGEVPLFRLPPETAARQLLLRFLDKAEGAAGRLVQGGDATALHDFRVALRRFRAAERAYRPWLDDAVPKKMRRRLKAVVQASGPARDGEVQLAWLHGQRAGLRGAQVSGHRWLFRRLEDRQREAEQALREELPAEFSLLAARLSAGLRMPCVPGEDSFARATGERLKPLVAELAMHLRVIGNIDGRRHVHPARLLCKRLRYLLEPIAPAIAPDEGLPAELAWLQDLLGEVNDAAVLGEALAQAAGEAGAAQVRAHIEAGLRKQRAARRSEPRSGLLALAQRLADQQRQGMAALRERHAGGADDRLLDRLGAAVNLLLEQAPAVPPVPADPPS